MTNPAPWQPDQTTPEQSPPDRKRGGCMKVGLIILGIFILVAILVTAINSGGLSDDEQATILDGVAVPASAEKTSSDTDREFFDVPDADFDEVDGWMGDRLPDEVEGLPLCGIDEGDASRQWVWSEGGENVPLALVRVSGADEITRVTLTRGEDLVDCGDGTSDQQSAPAAGNDPTPAPVESEPEVPRESQNALSTAERYLSMSGFSRQGLVDQLDYEDYSPEAAQYAVDNVEVDWNEQAARKAEQYLDMRSMSRQRLVDQLLYEDFTPEQAEYGVSQVY